MVILISSTKRESDQNISISERDCFMEFYLDNSLLVHIRELYEMNFLLCCQKRELYGLWSPWSVDFGTFSSLFLYFAYTVLWEENTIEIPEFLGLRFLWIWISLRAFGVLFVCIMQIVGWLDDPESNQRKLARHQKSCTLYHTVNTNIKFLLQFQVFVKCYWVFIFAEAKLTNSFWVWARADWVIIM